MGGAPNYRMGLWDAVMIKDNHAAMVGDVGRPVARARAAGVERIICEVDRIDQIEPAIAAGATHILLDNMSPTTLSEAVAPVAGRAAPEASGGVRLDTIGAIAAGGVDFASVGCRSVGWCKARLRRTLGSTSSGCDGHGPPMECLSSDQSQHKIARMPSHPIVKGPWPNG
ncbi:MAG: hypothetical protein U0414_38215 [Polyangiaceae bacterium]